MLVCDLCACPSLRRGPFLICNACMRQVRLDRADLAHERDRAKRVVRVFWRVRGVDGTVIRPFISKQRATSFLADVHPSWVANVYRVTVRRVKKAVK